MMSADSVLAPAHDPVQNRFLEGSFVLVLVSFALFPIAHLPIFHLPLYWSEMALVLSLFLANLSNRRWLMTRLSASVYQEKHFFFFSGIFLLGVLLSYSINPHALSGLGAIKSFYVIPVIFSATVLIWGETEDRLRYMALAWLSGLTAAAIASLAAAFFGWYLYDGRLAGLYQSPNHLAMLVAPGVLIAASLFHRSPERKKIRVSLIVSLGLILCTLWLTRSYAAWSALSLAFLVLFSLTNHSIRALRWPTLFVVLAAALLFLGESGSEKWQSLVSGDDRSSLASRVMIWKSAAKIAADSFPWGIGPGRFQEAYLDYQRFFPSYLEWAVPTPHNLYLHFFLEGGLLALLGFVGASVWTLVLARHSFTASSKRETSPFLVLGVALLSFYSIYGLVDTPYMKNDLALAVWGSLGFILAARKVKG